MQVVQEHRHELRQRVLKTGKIVFGAMTSVYDCTVRNRSTHGARLKLSTSEFVPSNFILRIPSENFQAEAFVTNRGENEIGVFLKV